MKEGTIANIINHINSVKKGGDSKEGICVILGAGADISSGGILFRELKLRFLRENNLNMPDNIIDDELDKYFQNCVEQMSRNGRCETLEKIMERHSAPSEGYELLVLLAELGYIDAVITTNFDYLLEETENLLNMHPFSIFAPGMSVPDEYYTRRNNIKPVYLKMHGDLYGRLVTHLTQEEIESKPYGEKYIALFKHIIRRNSLIFVGYSGFDDLITKIIIQETDEIQNIYWCNITEPNIASELASHFVSNQKLIYVKCTFDNLFQGISLELLKEKRLNDTNVVFLPTVLHSKINYQQLIFSKDMPKSTELIERSEAKKELEKYLSDYNTKCIIIKGGEKCGKTSFLYKYITETKDIDFIPVIRENTHGILENIAMALGYATDVPFSLLYNFSRWCHQKRKHVVFVLDNYFDEKYICNSSLKYILELCNFIYTTSEFKHVNFMISFHEDAYFKFKNLNETQTAKDLFSNVVGLEKFNDNEVKKLLNRSKLSESNLTSELYKLLHEPWVWNLIQSTNLSLSSIQNGNFFEKYVESLFSFTTLEDSFTKHSMNDVLKKMAYSEICEEDIQISFDRKEVHFLRKHGLLDNQSKFIYQIFAVHFCAKYLREEFATEEIINTRVIPVLKKNEPISDIQIKVYAKTIASISEINDLQIVLYILNNLLCTYEKRLEAIKLVLYTLTDLLLYSKELLVSYIKVVNIKEYSMPLQKCLLKVFAEHDNALISCLNGMQLSYEIFVLNNDYLYQQTKKSLSEKKQCDILNDYLLEHSPTRGLVTLLHLCSYFGWDNVMQNESKKLFEMLKKLFCDVKKKLKDTDMKNTVDFIKQYSYNLFFNAGEDFEEKYYSMIIVPELRTLIKNVLSGQVLSNRDYDDLMKYSADFNNSWIFFVCNIIVIQSMYNDFEKTYQVLLAVSKSYKNALCVQQLDFYLSSVFWSLYICKPYCRELFTEIFENVKVLHETLLFKFPPESRHATAQKFSEKFDLIFEDGFNPIAFYFYTAPSQSLITTSHDWNGGKDDLKIYWELAELLESNGNCNDILRIVHALGQMISIFPKEGYEALENLSVYDHPIIKQGVVRILKENYIRYNSETKKFIETTNFSLNKSDKEEIYWNVDSFIANRSFEQLHWGRLMYNLSLLSEKNVSAVFLDIILKSNSCSGFLQKILEELS